jgi:hypothetical protein
VVELTSYGLTGLTAMLVIAFCFACGDALPATQEKSSHDLINSVHMNDSSMIETGREACGSGGMLVSNEKLPRHHCCKTSAVETGHAATCNNSFRNDRGPLEAFHG